MHGTETTKEHLHNRREEILSELGGLERPIHDELDRSIDEQAIQLEQQDVTLSMVQQLNNELRQIEERLLEFEEE